MAGKMIITPKNIVYLSDNRGIYVCSPLVSVARQMSREIILKMIKDRFGESKPIDIDLSKFE